MTGSWLSVAAAFGLVALNGFFVATEFALVKVRPTRLDELARRGSAAARRANSREAPSIQRLPGGRYRVDPRTPVADFAHHFGIQIEAESAASVGGLVIEKLRRIPAVGDELVLGSVQLTVEEMDGPRIASLLAARSGVG
jgi:CBS domain containing-hemolysin-like protein